MAPPPVVIFSKAIEKNAGSCNAAALLSMDFYCQLDARTFAVDGMFIRTLKFSRLESIDHFSGHLKNKNGK